MPSVSQLIVIDGSTQTFTEYNDVQVSTDEIDFKKSEPVTAKDTEVVPITDDKEKEFDEEKLKIERKLNEYQEQLRTKDTKLLVLEKEVHNLRKDLALKEEEILTSPQLLRSRKASVELDGNFNEDQIKSMKVRSHLDIIFP